MKLKYIDSSGYDRLSCFPKEKQNNLFSQLISLFKSDLEGNLSHMQTLLNENKIKEFGDIAHRLKSSAASLGAENLKTLFFELEEQSRSSHFDLEALQNILNNVFSVYKKTFSELDQFLSNKISKF